ncbi:M3 family metallopeptidase [Hyphococcus sp.]|uniref:M3 family metallopeptidase n=1 Tax=Hyphococcus sp. TaxID=2038636 RepID=UPI003CCBC0C7
MRAGSKSRIKSIVSTMALVTALYGCSESENAGNADTTGDRVTNEQTDMNAESINEDTGDLFAGIEPATTDNEAANTLLSSYDGPYQGTPHFDEMDLSGLKPALEAGMAKNLAEVEAIANNPEPPTFANTIIALEKTGDELGRVFTYWGIWSSNMSSPEFRTIQQEMAPKLSEFFSKINQNEKLFERVKAVYESDVMETLRPDQQRLVWLVYDGFATNGATLEGEAKERYAEINKRLAELHTQFGNNVLADEENYVTYISEDQLSGLPDSFVKAAAAAAADRDREGEYAITNTRSSMDPFLTYSDERDLRETVWRTYYSRGDNGDENDNNAIIAEILQLRDERVKLLGYDNYASWRLQNRMAKNPENALELMEAVWPAALARVEEEVAEQQEIADAEGANITIEPWDYRYYMEKVRQAKYNLDSDEVKQYLQLDKLREAMFFVAGELFNFEFTPIPDGTVPVWHEDVHVWEVTDRTSGDAVGLWYLDPFARPGKRSGAWATSYRSHDKLDGEEKTVLSANNSNFIEGAPGEPVLVSWSDAETFFHEFGHGLHYLSSNVDYPTLNGGVRDYTEFQSQLLERWLATDEVIDNYLVHHETGEPIPGELVEKIKAAATFNQGFDTTEYLASALIDMRYHTVDPTGIDPDAFEREQLAALGMPEEIVMRHRSPHFGHIFSGEGYSAGYYGYMWADVLTADAAEAFAEAPGGFYDEDVAKRLVDNLFSPRNAVDPAEAYRAFRGRDAEIDALMRDRGFPVPGENQGDSGGGDASDSN